MCPTTIEEARKVWKTVDHRYQTAIKNLAYTPTERTQIEREQKLRAATVSEEEAKYYIDQVAGRLKIKQHSDGAQAILSPVLKTLTACDPHKALQYAACTLQRSMRYHWFEKPDIRVPAQRLKHGAQVAHFIRNEHVYMQYSRKQQALVLKALQDPNGEHYHNIFKNSNLPEIVLALLMQQKITPHQIFTILRRLEILADAKLEGRARVIDNNGEWSKAGRWLLENVIQKRKDMKPLTVAQLTTLRLLIAASPLSEQYFDETSLEYPLKDGFTQRFIIRGNILSIMPINPADPYKRHPHAIDLSWAMHDALILADLGDAEQLALAIPQLGIFPPQVIIDSLPFRVRPAAAYFPLAVLPYTKKGIHEREVFYKRELGDHDILYHRYHMSHSPVSITTLFVQLHQQLKLQLNYLNNQPINLSLELWDYGDFDFNYCTKKVTKAASITAVTELFCNVLLHGNGTTLPQSIGGYILTAKISMERAQVVEKCSPVNWQLAPLGVLFFINLINNKQQWQQFKLDPVFFIEPFKHYFTQLNAIYAYIKSDPPAMQIFKYEVYLQLTKRRQENKLLEIFTHIDAHKKIWQENLQIKKTTKTNAALISLAPNMLYLAYKNEAISEIRLNILIKNYDTQKKHPPKTLDIVVLNKEALVFYKAKKYTAAAAIFEKIVYYWRSTEATLAHQTQLYISLFNLGSSFYLNGDYGTAQPFLAETVRLHEDLRKKRWDKDKGSQVKEEDGSKYYLRLKECDKILQQVPTAVLALD